MSIHDLESELHQIKVAYQEAVENSRLKAGFLSRISHELRSPLGSLMSLHQLIINDLCDTPEEERESIKQAYESAKKLMTMIDQLVEVSKLESGKLNLENESFDLGDLLVDIYELISLEAENKNLKLLWENQTDNSLITTDKTRLTNMMFYLLEMTIDISEEGFISWKLDSDKIAKKYIIQINFNCQNIENILSADINFRNLPLSELKRLNSTPQFSHQMKKILAELLLEMMEGSLQLQNLHSEGENTRQLCLFLPFEVA